MSDRKHHWTWDDLRPSKRSQLQLELDLLHWLMIFPDCFAAISHVIPMLEFEKEIHGRLFHVLFSRQQAGQSFSVFELLEALNKQIDIGREWNFVDISNLQVRAVPEDGQALTKDERVIKLALLVFEGSK